MAVRTLRLPPVCWCRTQAADAVPKLLGGACKLCTSRCVLEELRSLGDQFSGARGTVLAAVPASDRSSGRLHLPVRVTGLSTLVVHPDGRQQQICRAQPGPSLRKQLRRRRFHLLALLAGNSALCTIIRPVTADPRMTVSFTDTAYQGHVRHGPQFSQGISSAAAHANTRGRTCSDAYVRFWLQDHWCRCGRTPDAGSIPAYDCLRWPASSHACHPMLQVP